MRLVHGLHPGSRHAFPLRCARGIMHARFDCSFTSRSTCYCCTAREYESAITTRKERLVESIRRVFIYRCIPHPPMGPNRRRTTTARSSCRGIHTNKDSLIQTTSSLATAIERLLLRGRCRTHLHCRTTASSTCTRRSRCPRGWRCSNRRTSGLRLLRSHPCQRRSPRHTLTRPGHPANRQRRCGIKVLL